MRGASLALVLAACAPEAEPVCDNALTWESFGHAFTSQYCAGCHSSTIPPEHRNEAPEVVNLDTYAGVLRWVDAIEVTAAMEPPSMPPGGGPTEAERELLREWLRCEVIPDSYRVEGALP